MDPLTYQVLTVLMYVVLTTLGAGAYVLVLVAMWRNAKQFANSFYYLVWHLAIGDCGMLLCQYVVAIPLSATGRPIYGDGALLVFLASGDSIFFTFIWWWTFVIALNRFGTFFNKPGYGINRLFEKPTIHLVLVGSWILVLLRVYVSDVLRECPKKFTHINYHFYRDCSNSTFVATPAGVTVKKWLSNTSYGLPVFTLVMYLAIYARLKINNRRVTAVISEDDQEAKARTKTERSLLLQSVIICLVLFMEVVMFDNVKLLFSVLCRLDCAIPSLLLSGIIILNSSINPYIFMVFNSAIKSNVRKLVFGNTVSVTTVSTRTVLHKTAA